MKKPKKKLLIAIILFGIAFVVNSCKDDFENQNTLQSKKSPYSMKTIYGDELHQKKNLFKSINTFNEKISNKSSVYNAAYDFTIETEFAKYIESEDGSFHTYTFLVHRDLDNGLVENLVFTSKLDGTYDTKLVTYDFIDDNTVEIKYGNINIDSDDYLNKNLTIIEICTTTLHYHTVIDTTVNVDECPNGPCYRTVIDYYETNCTFHYFENTTGGGGPTYGGATSGGSTDGGNGLGNVIWTGGGGSQNNGNSGNVNIATSPVILDHIQTLENQTCNSEVKARINQMRENIPNATTEQGSEFRNNNNGMTIGGDTYNEIEVPESNTDPTGTHFGNPVYNSEIRVHAHVNEHANGDYPTLSPSFEDIWRTYAFYFQVRNLNNKNSNLNNISSIIVAGVSNRLYAIRVLDPVKAQVFLNEIIDPSLLPSGITRREYWKILFEYEVISKAEKHCDLTTCSTAQKEALYEVYFTNFFKSLDSGLGLFMSYENNQNNNCPKWEFSTK